ncbi:MAG: Rrf2 family transcriptional regulator [Planctomycetota bacterium]
MLQLTKRTEYGLIALTHLATRAGEVVSVRELCEAYPLPKRLVAEVLKDLCREGLVDSTRGASGGYALARPAAEVSVGTVVATLEGHPSLTSCESLGAYVANATRGVCELESNCPIKSPIHQLRASLWSMLEATSLADLAQHDRAVSTAFLSR